MNKALVVYYSRSGNTRKVATELQSLLGCDVEEITEIRGGHREGLWGVLKSLLEGIFRREARILPRQKDPAHYDLVIVGTPVWSSSVSSPVRTYLAQNRGRIKSVAFFLTCMGHKIQPVFPVFHEMQELSGKIPVAALAVRERGSSREGGIQLREFAAVIGRPKKPRLTQAA